MRWCQRLIFGVLLAVGSALANSAMASPGGPAIPDYVGSQTCQRCHNPEYQAWRGSHHELAMQPANERTVLGDFDDHRLSHFGVTTRFFRDGNAFMVTTEGPEGSPETYEVLYTFGVSPLQQYLVAFPGGRMQALSLAWDSRPQGEGGQRWFHIYPDEAIAPGDELHWTELSHNWNSMCADCHSTNLRKNYDATSRTFATTWSEVNVACEACHGPGGNHVDWASQKPGWQRHADTRGLAVQLDERAGVQWQMLPGSPNAPRSEPRTSQKEVDMCARCHARRSPISVGSEPGAAFLDHYLPTLLTEGMYHPDGQIDDEVYVYGSFVQSKMFAAGVTCSDCHEPHSLALRTPGNGVCLQ